MAFTDQITTIETHAKAAGAALTNPMKDVLIGFPLPGMGRCGRIWWGGESGPETMGARYVLDAEMVADIILVSFFWPLSGFTETHARVTVLEMRALKHDLRTRINADSQLGGSQTDLRLHDFLVEWPVIGGTQYAALTAEIVNDLTEYPLAQ